MRKLMTSMLAIGLMTAVGFSNVQAQEVTDQDVKNYAIIELAKNSIIDGISPMVNEMIEKQEGMTGQRYQELQSAAGNQAKLTEIDAQEWEIKFYDLVEKQIDKKKEAATGVVKLLASNAMGAASYKATKAAVSSDASIKAKYEGYLAALK